MVIYQLCDFTLSVLHICMCHFIPSSVWPLNSISGLLISALCPLLFNGLSRPSLTCSISPVLVYFLRAIIEELDTFCIQQTLCCFVLILFSFIEPVYKKLTCVLGYIIKTTLCLRYIYVHSVTLTLIVLSVIAVSVDYICCASQCLVLRPVHRELCVKKLQVILHSCVLTA